MDLRTRSFDILCDKFKPSKLTKAQYGVLSQKNKQVLSLLYLTDKEIARELGMNSRAVEAQIEKILRVLNARNRTEALIKAVAKGLIELPQIQ